MRYHFPLKLLLASLAMVPAAGHAQTAYYGDDDGFGIGATSGTLDPTVDNATVGDAALTDVRLIGTGFAAGPFTPTGSFDAFVVGGPITSALLTIRLGGFTPSNPVDGPNILMLDGMAVNAAFLNSFSSSDGEDIETLSYALDATFFAALSDGLVSLNGTHISEGSGFGSFQVDFLRLDINGGAGAVPEPSTWAMMLLGFGAVGFAMRRKKANSKLALSA